MSPDLWLERKFPKGLGAELLADIIERLKGTPVRIKEILLDIPESTLIFNPDGKWSIKEHVGHLSDLEELWIGRFEDFEAGEKKMRAWDASNEKTHSAIHNQYQIDKLLAKFDTARINLLLCIHSLSEEMLHNTAIHPRLLTPMNPVDLAFFIAEHDDHHLAHIDLIIDIHS